MALRLCFLAPSSYGKTTAIAIMQTEYKIVNIKIAEPLYELQDYFYQKIGINIKEQQDGELLQFYGVKIRKENPHYLLTTFIDKINNIKDVDIITNDDCRPYDYDCLKELGFIFVKINGYKRNRLDHTLSNDNLSLEWQNNIPCDYILDNLDDLNTYQIKVKNLVKEIIYDRQMLPYSYTKKM
jgi:hypothetical protein